MAAGRPARARVSARRSASGAGTGRPCAGPGPRVGAGIPAAVTNRGRAEDPPRTGTAWMAVRNLDLATPITGMPNSACACAPRPAGCRDPDRRSRRPPAGPARSGRPGPRAAAGARAGRTLPGRQGATEGTTAVRSASTCAKAALAARTAAARAPPVLRYCTSTAAHTPQAGHPPFPCPEDARTCARHQDHVLAAARAGADSKQPRMSRSVIGLPRARARVTAVISSPDLGVFPVTAAGVCVLFPASWMHYLNSVSAADLVRSPLSLLLLELNVYRLNLVQRHVYAADVLVRCGVDREDFR